MANIRSQIKRNRQNEKGRLRNKAVRSEMRTRTKRALQSAVQGSEDAAEDLRLALRAVGRITGSVGVEDILDTLFARFCIGK